MATITPAPAPSAPSSEVTRPARTRQHASALTRQNSDRKPRLAAWTRGGRRERAATIRAPAETARIDHAGASLRLHRRHHAGRSACSADERARRATENKVALIAESAEAHAAIVT